MSSTYLAIPNKHCCHHHHYYYHHQHHYSLATLNHIRTHTHAHYTFHIFVPHLFHPVYTLCVHKPHYQCPSQQLFSGKFAQRTKIIPLSSKAISTFRTWSHYMALLIFEIRVDRLMAEFSVSVFYGFPFEPWRNAIKTTQHDECAFRMPSHKMGWKSEKSTKIWLTEERNSEKIFCFHEYMGEQCEIFVFKNWFK